jgi:hypothetical protein
VQSIPLVASVTPITPTYENAIETDARIANVDELMTDLMEMHTESSAAAVDIPPVSVVTSSRRAVVAERAETYVGATAGVYVEVMSGPNAGQISPMTKSEFVLGKAGATKAVIRQDGEQFILLPRSSAACIVNHRKVPPEGACFGSGDVIEVAGVRLRFGRRPPL